MMSSPSKLKDQSDGGTSFRFTTQCHHYGSVRPVRATGGAKEGQWICKIIGPTVKGGSGTKTVYCSPDMNAAQYAIARYLRVQASTVYMRSEMDASVFNSPTKSMTSPPTAEKVTAAIVSPPSLVKTVPLLPLLHNYDYDSLMAKATPHGRDIWETSPNRLAKCKVCGDKIQKGQQRIGKWTHNEYYHRSRHVYYHAECASDALKATLHLKDTRNDYAKRQSLLKSRKDLREKLRKLRLSFASSLHVEPFRIFHDVSLDDITIKLPTTKSELMNCYGIKEKKFRSFGSAILEVTQMYSRKKTGGREDGTNKIMGISANASGDESNDEEVEVLDCLTCEEIVKRKLEHAATHGYIIEL